MVISNNQFEVIGEGAVTVIDGGAMTYTDVPYIERGQSIALAGVKIHVLPNSYKFDFKTRQMITPERAAQKVKAASLNENEKTEKK